MANEETHIERKQAENRRRDIQADLDAQKSKHNKEKFDEQRKTALKHQRERREAETTRKPRSSHNLDFSGHEKHGINEVSAKIHTTDLNEDYQRQAAQHFHEQRAEEIEKKQSSKQRRRDSVFSVSGKSEFSSYGVGKVYTTHFENNTVTYSGSKTVSFSQPKPSNQMLPKQSGAYTVRTVGNQAKSSEQSSYRERNSYYTSHTFNNRGQSYSQHQTRSMSRDNVPDLSDTSVRFRYAKQAVRNYMYTTQRVYSAAGQSVYHISQNGDYGTIHTFEQMRRGAVGTVAAIRVIGNMPHNTMARTAAIGSYAKATVLNASRYIKGANTAKLLLEKKNLHGVLFANKKSVGVFTQQQMQRHIQIQKQLAANAKTLINRRPLVTLKQVRAEMNCIFTAEQLKDLAMQYGGLAMLPLTDINKQICTLNRKKEFGALTASQTAKLAHLGELKEIHKAALQQNGKLLELSASKINREIRKLKKLQKSGILSTSQKLRLDKLTELKSIYATRRNIKENIRARHRMLRSMTGAIRQFLIKSENAGMDGLLMATELASNHYVHTIIREIGKLNRLLMRTATKPVAWAAKTTANKTGLTKQITKLQTKTTKKFINSKPVKTLVKLQQQVNGKAYSAVKQKISAKTPQGLKTAAKKTATAAKNISKGTGKIANTLKKGSDVVSKPFRVIKQTFSKVFKVAKAALLAASGGLLFLFVIVAIVSTIASAVSSVILEDVENLNEYIQVLNNEQTQFKQTLTSLGKGYRNVVYEYTDGSKMNNTREILCMATVYLQQDFEDKDAVKVYLRQMFNASHFYSTQESPTYYCSDGEGCDNHKRETITKSDGTKETKFVCQGHKDLTVTITALTFDEIFNASVNATGVGDLCFAFETGGQTLGSYNVWYCEDINDGAGMNYGMMSTNRGQATNMWNYIKANSPVLAAQFAGIDSFTGDNLHPFSNAFNTRWKGAHTPEETAEMEKLQRAWVWNAYGAIWCADLKSKTGVDMTRSWALKEVALSRAVHRGAYSAKSFYNCVNSNMTDEQIIDAIYDHECSTLSSFMSRWNLERTYAKSFLGRTEPTADDNSDQFTWDEGNIEWCKNLYGQDWEELYEGLVGLNSATVGSSMTEAEVEALIGSIDGLSQERKNILSWACSAVGKIPYHWDWRSYWTIDAEDWGTPCTPDYKGRSLKGLDCSGFVVWCYNKAGYDPITCGWGSTGWTGSIADSPKTMKISQSELKPGDIGMTGAYPYTHTGIYAGNGKWIHCTGAPTNNTVCNAYGGFSTYYRMTDLD